MTLSELIERLEKATGPDRELDETIAFHAQLRPAAPTPGKIYVESRLRESFDEHERKHDFATAWHAHAPWRADWPIPTYTASLDAALTLVRPEDDIDSYELLNDCGCWFVVFNTLVEGGHIVETRTVAGALDGALEFCRQYFHHTAALRARGTGGEDGRG